MQIIKQQLDTTKVSLVVSAELKELADLKQKVVGRLGTNAKVAGFRAGKAPANIVEKQLDQTLLQSEFLDAAVNQLFAASIKHEKLRPASQPDISITKFVPFTTLEFSAEVSVIGDIVLADYKKVKLPVPKVEVSAKDVNEVIETLRTRSAIHKPVSRAARLTDEITIDFIGTEIKNKKPFEGGSGTDQKLVLGSKTFIPGFEDGLIGAKVGESKDIPLTFPKDYGVKQLQGAKVNFAVTIKAINELNKPTFDNEFAASIGPFKTVVEAKDNIKKDLIAERQRENMNRYDNELLAKISEKSSVAIPDPLIEDEIDRMEEDEKRNLTYRGQTWQDHLKEESITNAEHRSRQKESAEQRVKAGLVLAEIAERENITVSPEELEVRIMLLKNQYSDSAMQLELDKPENRRDINNRMLTEKTLDRLRSYATK